MAAHPQGNLVGIFGPGGFVAADHLPQKEPLPALPPEIEFADVMRAAGYQVSAVKADTANIQRCPDAQDQPNGDTGWYRLWTTGKRPAGAFGTWRIEGYTVWAQGATNGDNRLSFEQQRELDAEILAHRQRAAAARDAGQQSAAQAAATFLAGGTSAEGAPYLVRKKVRAHPGLVQRDNLLLIPRQDVDGVLWSYHSISVDGAIKKHQKGGRVSGTFFPMGNPDGAELIALAEGYATAATVHEATGWTVLACLDAGNISKVAAAVRTRFPAARLVVAVDDDHEKTPNTGKGVGEKCAAEFAATVATPTGLGPGESDWNDLAVRIGLDAVRGLLEGALGEDEAPVVDASTWFDCPAAPVDWTAEPFLVRGYVNALYADGGTGKTTLVQQLGTCMAAGLPWFGRTVMPGPVLLVLCEDDEAAVHRRQVAINRYLKLDAATGLRHPLHVMARLSKTSFLARRSRDGVWTTTEFFRQLCRRVERHGYHSVFFDSLADAYPGNEIDRAAVSEFVVGTLAHLAVNYHCAVTFLGHTPKAQGGNSPASFSGSTAWNAKVKSRLLLARDPHTPMDLVLSLEKSNFAPTGERLELRTFGGVIVQPDELFGSDASVADIDPAAACEDAFLVMLREAMAAKQRLSASPNANNSACRHFTKNQRRHHFPLTFKVGQFEDAMHALLRRNIIGSVPHRGGDRFHLEVLPAGKPWQADDADTLVEP